MDKRVSKYFNPHEYECWITGPEHERVREAKAKAAPRVRQLSKAERQCLDHFHAGWTTMRIARTMNIAEVTVRRYINSAKAKERTNNLLNVKP